MSLMPLEIQNSVELVLEPELLCIPSGSQLCRWVPVLRLVLSQRVRSGPTRQAQAFELAQQWTGGKTHPAPALSGSILSTFCHSA